MSGYLKMTDGAMVSVRDGLVLGRVAACDVVVDDPKASRRHARVLVESGVVEVEDMKSSNGTLLNGKPVTRRMLRDGDEVRIGKTVIVYHEGSLPGSSNVSSAASDGGAIFDDDDDLLGGGGDPVVTRAPEPSTRASDDLLGDDLLGDEDVPEAPTEVPISESQLAPPPEPSPSGNVVEFEDEVVELAPKKQAPRREPEIEVRQVSRAETSSGRSPKAKGNGDDLVSSSQGILQYSKKSSGSGPLGDDMGQMSGGMRTLIVVAAIAIGIGIVYGIMTSMR